MAKDKKKQDIKTDLTVSQSALPAKKGVSDMATVGKVIKSALEQMDKFQQAGVKVHETHDGGYYQENKKKGQQVIAKKGIVVAKQPHSINITITDPAATPKEIIQEKPFVPTQKVSGIIAGGKSQSEVSKIRKKKK